MVAFELVDVSPQPAAVIRGAVPMDGLTGFFDGAYTEVMAVLGAAGVAVTGPPFAFYPSTPTDVVEVVAGFPVASTVERSGRVEPFVLPGGRAVQGVHVGPYDRLVDTYAELARWTAEQGLTLATGMWEVYLSDPSAEPDPAAWQTLVVWPLAT